MNQWSVLSPLQFHVVMDVVTSETRSGIPSECMMMTLVLTAPLMEMTLVLTAPLMEPLGRRLVE